MLLMRSDISDIMRTYTRARGAPADGARTRHAYGLHVSEAWRRGALVVMTTVTSVVMTTVT